MKIVHTADWHLGYEPEGRENDGYDAFDWFIKNIKDYDAIFVTGDLFDSVVPPPKAYVIAQQLNELGKPFYIIPGNHDFADVCPANVLSKLQCFKQPTILQLPYSPFNNLKIGLLPFSRVYIVPDEFKTCDIVFAHGKIREESTYRIGPYLPAMFDKVKYVALGDLHFKVSYGNLHYCGAPWRIDFSQENKTCGFSVIDTDTWTSEYIEIPSRRFLTIKGKIPDLDTLDKNTHVRLVYNKDIHTQKEINLLKQKVGHVRIITNPETILLIDKKAALMSAKELLNKFCASYPEFMKLAEEAAKWLDDPQNRR